MRVFRTSTIDLTSGKITIEDTDPQLIQKYLGGRGLGAALLYESVDASIGPFDAENRLIFTTGLFNDTSWPTSSRYHVTFKSPATEAYGYANSGGYFGPEFRKAGYDALIVTGKAKSPVVLQLTDQDIEIKPAEDLWGKNTSETERILRQQGGRVASIGPAGENLARLAAIINDGGRAAARGGPGAVMGSKNLKAIHVIASKRSNTSPPSFSKIAGSKSKKVFNHSGVQDLREKTTVMLMEVQNYFGKLPARNHQVAGVPFIDKLDSQAISKFWLKRKSCAACPIGCARKSGIDYDEGFIEIEGPEYETTNAFGPMVWNDDPEVVIAANHMCNEYGLDTISVGVTIAFAMECYQRGLLEDDLFSLEWGDKNTILGLVEAIAFRKGIGDLLAEGTQRAAKGIGRGAEKFAMQVKGLELPRQEPRKAIAFGLGHCTSNRGADHLYALPTLDAIADWETARKIFPEEIVEGVMSFTEDTYKPDLVVYNEHFCAIADSVGICKFSTPEMYALLVEDLAEGLNALCFECTSESLLKIGERIVNLERMYNVRHGMDRRDDQLPERFTNEPLPIFQSTKRGTGSKPYVEPESTGPVIKLHPLLDRYYQLRGWDSSGIPTSKKLKHLGISIERTEI